MSNEFMRKTVDLLFPDGAPHEPDPDGDYSNLRDGIGANLEDIRGGVREVAFLRTPSKTPDLKSLEKDYGLAPLPSATLDERIESLEQERYKKKTTAQPDELQRRLQAAGFDLFVYNNSPEGPAIDPAIILDQNFVMQAMEGTNYYAGNDDAYAGRVGGETLVNGDLNVQTPGYFGAGDLFAGNDNAHAGYFERLILTPIEYPLNTIDQENWPYVFFVGGLATFNPDGSIQAIEQGLVPTNRERELKKMILKYKPLFSWCGLVVTFN